VIWAVNSRDVLQKRPKCEDVSRTRTKSGECAETKLGLFHGLRQ